MSKLIMWNLITLDGMFDGPQPWELPFHQYAWGDELERFSLQQAEEVGALVFGRRTYEGMAAHWTTTTGEIADFMNAVPKYVFSRTLESADWSNTTLVKGEASEAVPALNSWLNAKEGTLRRHSRVDVGAHAFQLGPGVGGTGLTAHVAVALQVEH